MWLVLRDNQDRVSQSYCAVFPLSEGHKMFLFQFLLFILPLFGNI